MKYVENEVISRKIIGTTLLMIFDEDKMVIKFKAFELNAETIQLYIDVSPSS